MQFKNEKKTASERQTLSPFINLADGLDLQHFRHHSELSTEPSAVTTDFKGWDDAIFKLVIDADAPGCLTAVGQASEDSPISSTRVGGARYYLDSGELNEIFGTNGQNTKHFQIVYGEDEPWVRKEEGYYFIP